MFPPPPSPAGLGEGRSQDAFPFCFPAELSSWGGREQMEGPEIEGPLPVERENVELREGPR